MDPNPQLVTIAWTTDGHVTYKCTLCDREFAPPDNHDGVEASEQLLAVFHSHVLMKHSTGVPTRKTVEGAAQGL